MKLTQFTKMHRYKDTTSHKHGRAFFNAWDEAFKIPTIPEQPGRYE